MTTLAIQCSRCKFKSWLEFDPSDLTSLPYRECEEYPDGVPEFVQTVNPDDQKDCPQFEKK